MLRVKEKKKKELNREGRKENEGKRGEAYSWASRIKRKKSEGGN